MSSAQVASWCGFRRRSRTGLGGNHIVVWMCGLFMIAVVLAAILAPILSPQDPFVVDPASIYSGSTTQYLLGSDDTGRDILSRIIHGARPSLMGPAIVILVAAVVGSVLAVWAAWVGGWIDAFIARVFDVLFAFPGLILAVLAAAVFGVGLVGPAIALSIAYIPYIGRVIRSAAQKERQRAYIAALEIQGMSAWWICVRHILPNVLPLLIVQSSVAFGYALLDLAAVSYVGLGVQPPTPEWGLMVSNGQPAILAGHPQQSLFAGAAIVITVLSINLLGTRLSEWMGTRR